MKFSHQLSTMRFDIGIKSGKPISKSYLSREAKIARQLIYELENGSMNPGLSTLIKLGKFCMKRKYDPIDLYISAGLSFKGGRKRASITNRRTKKIFRQ